MCSYDIDIMNFNALANVACMVVNSHSYGIGTTY